MVLWLSEPATLHILLFVGLFYLPKLQRELSYVHDTVDGRNPAPVEVGSLSHYFKA